jgi:hypothetical protein
MNHAVLNQLINVITTALPDVTVEVDEGKEKSSRWFVDFTLVLEPSPTNKPTHVVHVELWPEKGFGVTCDPDTSFEGPHETYTDVAKTAARVLTLLAFRERTKIVRGGKS